jgi:hypothetical protein
VETKNWQKCANKKSAEMWKQKIGRNVQTKNRQKCGNKKLAEM